MLTLRVTRSDGPSAWRHAMTIAGGRGVCVAGEGVPNPAAWTPNRWSGFPNINQDLAGGNGAKRFFHWRQAVHPDTIWLLDI